IRSVVSAPSTSINLYSGEDVCSPATLPTSASSKRPMDVTPGSGNLGRFLPVGSMRRSRFPGVIARRSETNVTTGTLRTCRFRRLTSDANRLIDAASNSPRGRPRRGHETRHVPASIAYSATRRAALRNVPCYPPIIAEETNVKWTRAKILAAVVLACSTPTYAAPVTVGGDPFTLLATGPGTQLFGLASDGQGRVYAGNNSNNVTGISLQRFDPALFSGAPIALQSFGPAVGD